MKKTIPPSAIAKTAAGVGTVAATVALGMLVKRQRVRATCKPFYSGATRCFKIPGLNEGFVPQDLFYLDDEKTWLFSGYEANRKPSPIFQVSEDGHVRRHEVLFPAAPFTAATEPPSPPRAPSSFSRFATDLWPSTARPSPMQPTATSCRPPGTARSPFCPRS